MNHINLCIIEGNIVKDPEVKTIEESQKVVTAFTLAQHKSYINSKKELIEDVNFINIEAWGAGFAEKIAIHLHKGVFTRVQGRLRQNVWLDSEGKKHEKIIIIADSVDFRSSGINELITGEKLSNTMEVEVIESNNNETKTSKKKTKGNS